MLRSCPIELHQIVAFVAVAEHGCMTKAAGELHIAQPALSRKVKKLESVLGVELFERKTRVLWLTAAGKRFLTDCRYILRHVELARHRAAGADN